MVVNSAKKMEPEFKSVVTFIAGTFGVVPAIEGPLGWRGCSRSQR